MNTLANQDTVSSRLPNPAKLIPELGSIGGALYKATGNGSIPQVTIGLVQLRAGQVVANSLIHAVGNEWLPAR